MMAQATQIERLTLTQEFRMFIPPAPVKRTVTLLVPASPQIVVALDKTPEQLGPNRAYKGVPLPDDQCISFKLEPHQFVVGASVVGVAEAGYIIEYGE